LPRRSSASPDVRLIASGGPRDDEFLTATISRTVHVWSLRKRGLVRELDTIVDFGGGRLALCRDGRRRIVVAGAWEREGICGYGADGRVWQRKDLRQSHRLVRGQSGELLSATFERRATQVLVAATGDTVATLRGARNVYWSTGSPLALIETAGAVALVETADWQRLGWEHRLTGFATLDAAFSPDAVLVADVEGELVCLDFDGAVRWGWRTPASTNCRTLAWDDDAGQWVGVTYNVNHKAPSALLRWTADGEALSRTEIGLRHELRLLASGRHLVADTDVLDARTGQGLWSLTV
jgi:hypothetical protein